MDREVRIAFLANTASFARDIQSLATKVIEVQNKINKLFDPLVNIAKNVGRTMIGFSSTLGAALGLASKSAMQFEVNMRNVNSILGASPAEFAKLEQQILHLAGTVPKSANDLSQAAYQIVSTGYTNATDLNNILAVSARAATAGLTSTEVAADGITTALQAYGLKATDANHVSDALFQTVNVGKVNFQELSQQMGDFLGITKSVGVSLEESLGLYASLTLATGQYAQSATAMVGISNAFLRPSKEMAEALAKLKLQGISVEASGLTKVLYALKDGVHGDNTQLAAMFQNVEGLRGVLALTRQPLSDTQSKLVQFLDPLKLNGATAKVFAEQMKAIGNQLTQLHTALGSAAISVGTALLPFGFVVKALTDMANAFNSLPDPVKQTVGLMLGFAAVLGTVGGFVIVFRAKALLMTLAMKALNLDTKGLIATGISFGREFTGKAKILTLGAEAASKMTGAINKLGADAIPGATQSMANLGARIPKIGTQVSDLTMKLGTGLGIAMTKVTSVSGGMSTGFERIGSVIGFASKAITTTQNIIVKTIQILPKLGAAAIAAFAAFQVAQQIGDWIHHDTDKVHDFTVALESAAKVDLAPPAKEIKTLGDAIHNAGLRDPGLVKGIYSFSDTFSRLAGPLEGGGAKARETVKKLGQSLKDLFQLDPVAAAKEYKVYSDALLRAGVSQKDLDIVFKDYIKSAQDAGIAANAMTPPLSAVDQAEVDLTAHTMKLTAAQEALKGGLTSWGDLSGELSKATSKMQSMTSATQKDTTAEQANAKAHEQWLKGAVQRDIAVQQAAIGVTRATDAVTAAQKHLDEVRADTGHALRLANAEMALQASYRNSDNAIQHVIDVTKQLNDMRHPPARTIQEAEDALTTAQNAQADSAVALTQAQDKLAFARLQGTPQEIAQSERELTNAQIDQRAKINAVADAQAALDKIRAGGDPAEVAKLERDLADAQDAQTTATQGITDAQKNLKDVKAEDETKILTDAQLALTEAQLGLRSATDQVTTANDALKEQLPSVTSAVDTFNTKTKDAKVSAKDFSDQLKQDQIEQNNWLTNLDHIAKVGPPGLATALAKLGTDGMQIVSDLKDKSPGELQTMFDTMNANAITKTGEWAVWVEAGFKDGKGRAEAVTTDMVNNIAFQLGITVEEARRIMSSYLGVINTAGVAAVGSNQPIQITINPPAAPGPPKPKSQAINPDDAVGAGVTIMGYPMAAGGIELHNAQISHAMRIWAEPETGGEAYIPLSAAKRAQSVQILSQVAKIFGMSLIKMADGGMMRPARQIVAVGGSGKSMDVQMPIHVEARVAAGVDMDYASRVIGQQVEAGVRKALSNLEQQVKIKSWRN